MINSKILHIFTAGLFLSSVLTANLWVMLILATILILIWGNFILPILSMVILDSSFVGNRELVNAYGFILTSVTIVATIILLKLRKFLNL